ncbi:MAG: hypothetical protein ACRD8O_13570, partial [Bryobacteraceae bacterium]
RMIRANMPLDEGDIFDSALFQKGLARINQSRFFEPLDEHSIELRTNPATRVADVRVHLRERRFGSWLISGPAGPTSVGGPLRFALASRLPSWGRGIFELSRYTASFSLLLPPNPLANLIYGSSRTFLPVFAIERPYSPAEGWKSGFTIAPQLGWRGMVAGYAATQLTERLMPGIAGRGASTPELPVVVEGEKGEAILLCGSKDKLKWLRIGAGLAFQLGTAFAAL